MSSDSSWWIWIGFILIFLFNVFRKIGGRSAGDRARLANEEMEEEKEEADQEMRRAEELQPRREEAGDGMDSRIAAGWREKEIRLTEVLQTLREAAQTQAPAPRASSPSPETRDRAAARARRTAAPAHRPPVSLAPRPAAAISGLLPHEEEHPDLREALAFSDDPLIQGIVISEMLSPPVGLRPPERLV